MGSPLGDFVRTKRDATSPATVGVAPGNRRRAPGLRRSELAALAGMSVEYLTRIEQGRDRSPSMQIVTSLATALHLDAAERDHLRRLAKSETGMCTQAPQPNTGEVRRGVLAVLQQLEPGPAVVTNRWGDLLATTSGFDTLARPLGILDEPQPNLTRYLFTDPRARTSFGDWARLADASAFALWLAPNAAFVADFLDSLPAAAATELRERRQSHRLPDGQPHVWHHPGGDLTFHHESLELGPHDNQQIVVLVPSDDATVRCWDRIRRDADENQLRVVR